MDGDFFVFAGWELVAAFSLLLLGFIAYRLWQIEKTLKQMLWFVRDDWEKMERIDAARAEITESEKPSAKAEPEKTQ
ncbi:MAG: hypothetical protein VX599_03165 [Pseudomonadota bacterium]|nr:hypothetical protein [Pseudomonadota bacterium]